MRTNGTQEAASFIHCCERHRDGSRTVSDLGLENAAVVSAVADLVDDEDDEDDEDDDEDDDDEEEDDDEDEDEDIDGGDDDFDERACNTFRNK